MRLLDFSKTRLRTIVLHYLSQVERLKAELKTSPDAWGSYQSKFNSEVDHLFSQIIVFERRALKQNDFQTLDRMKSFFVRRFRRHFYYGDLSKWSIDKPFGYAGDFRVIDAIYENNPRTSGYDRLFDNYFLLSAISVAVRNRKGDFKRRIVDYAERRSGRRLRIMNLASGPCREIAELSNERPDLMQRISFDCYDSEKKAHRHAARLINGRSDVNFVNENALKLALTREIARKIPFKYDFIYSMGLFDYLNYAISVRLIRNLRDRLQEGGELHIADVRDRYYNPSVMYMEWAGDWNLIYRPDEEFFRIFLDAGFPPQKIHHAYEQQGVIQYIGAEK